MKASKKGKPIGGKSKTEAEKKKHGKVGLEGKRKHTKAGHDELKHEQKKAKTEEAEEREEISSRLNKLTGSILLQDKDVAERDAEISELFDHLKTKVAKYAQRHDMSRSIQACFRFGTEEMKDTILKELEGTIVSLCKNKYSVFMVIAFLRYSHDQQRMKILNELRSHVSRLGTHNCGARVLDFAFEACESSQAVPEQQVAQKKKQKKTTIAVKALSVPNLLKKLKMEFYGPELSVFADPAMSVSESKDPEKMMFDSLDLKKRRSVLTTLTRIATKQAEKGLLTYKFAQRVMWNLIRHCEDQISELKDEAVEETKILEKLIPLVAEACLPMISSKEGALAVARCIALGSAKERKKFCRALKGHVAELCFHEYGYIVLVTTINVVDDTVLLKKSVINELADLKFADTLYKSCMADKKEKLAHGKLSYLQILAPANSRYFTAPELQAITAAPGTSKKDPATKREEMKEIVQEVLIKVCSGHGSDMLLKQQGADMFVEVVAAFKDSSMIQEVLELVESTPAVLEDATGHRNIKRIVPLLDDESATKLLDVLKPNMLNYVSINRASFVVASLLEHQGTKQSLAKILADKKIAAALKKSGTAGSKVIQDLLLKI